MTMVRLEARGTFTTWTCAHCQVTEVHPGSPIAERGYRPGIEVELCGITSVTWERPHEAGTRVQSETRTGEYTTIQVPSEGEAIYIMDDRRNTTRVLRPTPEMVEAFAAAERKEAS